ncbi:hypothetical protein [Amycolatopsis sp. NPDC051903]
MIGPGDPHWSTVPVHDVAELSVLALEKAQRGSYFIGAKPTAR